MQKPDDIDVRICFCIYFFYDEAKADEYAAYVEKKGFTYNGGMFHGMPCGRDKSFDKIDADGRKMYAVTN